MSDLHFVQNIERNQVESDLERPAIQTDFEVEQGYFTVAAANIPANGVDVHTLQVPVDLVYRRLWAAAMGSGVGAGDRWEFEVIGTLNNTVTLRWPLFFEPVTVVNFRVCMPSYATRSATALPGENILFFRTGSTAYDEVSPQSIVCRCDKIVLRSISTRIVTGGASLRTILAVASLIRSF